MKKIILILAFVGCTINSVDLTKEYGVVYNISSYSGKCRYSVHKEYLIPWEFYDMCGKYQIGDTIRFIVSPVQPTTAANGN